MQGHVVEPGERPLQGPPQPEIDLDDVDEADAGREVGREDPLPPADLQDDVLGRQLRGPLDDPEDVGVA